MMNLFTNQDFSTSLLTLRFSWKIILSGSVTEIGSKTS